MKRDIDFLGNVEIVKSLAELPKFGEDSPVFYKDTYCIGINVYEYEDISKEVGQVSESEAEKYLFFKAYYCKEKGKNIYLYSDTVYFLYCVLKENIK